MGMGHQDGAGHVSWPWKSKGGFVFTNPPWKRWRSALFLLLPGLFFVFLPHCVSPSSEMSVVQTEGFEYTERSVASGKSWVNAAAPGRRFLSTSTTRSCQGTPKKHSTQNTQFAYVLFLFLLMNVFLQLFVFVLALRRHSCFCCCALNRLQGLCQFLKTFN